MTREQLFELRRRTFDTPSFRGIEFIEVEAKSIINHVPGSYLPFNWTINPYRGCSHACVYCMAGDTPILMADGRTKCLADVQVGDAVYGTQRRGAYRRYVETEVLDHWATVKPAYRITLEDGSMLISSGDHRFLSNRGWKYVTGTEQGPNQRPHLTANNRLWGLGAFASRPQATAEYRRGYLCGLIRGDGHVGSYSYARRERAAEVHRFRLALTDFEALRRAREYLLTSGIATHEFLFQEAVGSRRALNTIRTSTRAGVASIQELARCSNLSSHEWCKGFLAGIYDAEGSYSRGVLRIANTDPSIIHLITECLFTFEFAYTLETSARERPVSYVRLLGGTEEHLRFFLTTDPAISRKRSIVGRALKNSPRRRVLSVKALGVELPMFDISTGTGDFIANGVVSHNCFARVTHTYMDMDAGRDFESKIVVKVNAAERLRRELRAKRWKGEHIAMGTATDPYQRAEGRYRLMPPIIRALAEVGNPFSILTKGTLILRDLDLLVDAARRSEVATALSIGTLDEDAWRRSEPGTPHPRKRMEAVAKLNRAGIPCGVMVAPVLPGITDRPEQLRAVVSTALDAGATHVSPILLHLRPGVKDVYMRWLHDNFPELEGRYRAMYRKSAYASQKDRDALGSAVGDLAAARGPQRRAAPRIGRRAEPKPEAEQLRLL
jgi:DNA repair photolyase